MLASQFSISDLPCHDRDNLSERLRLGSSCLPRLGFSMQLLSPLLSQPPSVDSSLGCTSPEMSGPDRGTLILGCLFLWCLFLLDEYPMSFCKGGVSEFRVTLLNIFFVQPVSLRAPAGSLGGCLRAFSFSASTTASVSWICRRRAHGVVLYPECSSEIGGR